LHDDVGLRKRLVLRINHVEIGFAAFVDDLPHLRPLLLGQGNDLREISRRRQLLHGRRRYQIRAPDRVAGIGDDQTLELRLEFGDRLQCREDACLKVGDLSFGFDRRNPRDGAVVGETHDAALLHDGFVERVLLNSDVAPRRDQVPVRVLDLRDRRRGVDQRLRFVRIGTDDRQLQLMFNGVHSGVLEQRLRNGQAQGGLIVGIERIDDDVIVGARLRDAGAPLQSVDGLTAHSGRKRILVLHDVAWAGRGTRSGCADPDRLASITITADSRSGEKEILRRGHGEVRRRLDVELYVEVGFGLNDAVARDSNVRSGDRQLGILQQRHSDGVLQRNSHERILRNADDSGAARLGFGRVVSRCHRRDGREARCRNRRRQGRVPRKRGAHLG
jgi:hypothetical protein